MLLLFERVPGLTQHAQRRRRRHAALARMYSRSQSHELAVHLRTIRHAAHVPACSIACAILNADLSAGAPHSTANCHSSYCNKHHIEPHYRHLPPCMRAGEGSPIFSVDVHPAGTRLATAGKDLKVKIWNLLPVVDVQQELNPVVPKLLTTLADHYGDVNIARFSRDGKRLASGAKCSQIISFFFFIF